MTSVPSTSLRRSGQAIQRRPVTSLRAVSCPAFATARSKSLSLSLQVSGAQLCIAPWVSPCSAKLTLFPSHAAERSDWLGVPRKLRAWRWRMRSRVQLRRPSRWSRRPFLGRSSACPLCSVPSAQEGSPGTPRSGDELMILGSSGDPAQRHFVSKGRYGHGS